MGLRRRKSLPQTDQLEKRTVELDNVIFRSPRMAIARPDLKAQPAIERRLGFEIRRSDDEMIDRAGQCPSRRLLQLHDIVQRRVGPLEEAPDPPRGLANALLVLHQREAHVIVAMLAKADARRHRDVGLLDQQF